jgi:hypothetical protein
MLETLVELVPPPRLPVNAGSSSAWEEVCREIGMNLPTELYDLSSTYGSGQFVSSEFWVEIHSVFRPAYSNLAEWNRRIFAQEAIRDPALYAKMFELGAYGEGDELSPGRLFWEMDDSASDWIIGVTRPVTRFEPGLLRFLVALFQGDVAIAGLPIDRSDLRFEPWAPAPSPSATD